MTNVWEKIHSRLVNQLMIWLKNGNMEDDESNQKIRYALSSILGELEKCIMLGICFGCIGIFNIYILSLCSIVMLRIFMGGQHRKNMLGCFVHSFFVFTIIYMAGVYINIMRMNHMIYMLTIANIWYSTPIESEQRIKYSKLSRTRFKAKALTSLFMISIVISSIPTYYGNYCLWSIMLQNVDVVVAIVMQKKKGEIADEDTKTKGL